MTVDRGNAALWTTLAANVGAILILPPETFVWLLVVDLMLGAGVLGFMYVDADQRADREAGVNVGLSIQLRAAARRTLTLKREIRRLFEVNQRVVGENQRLLNEVMHLHLKLTDAERAAGIGGGEMVPVPLLRIVRDEPAVAEWDAILRATGDRP